MSPLFSYYSSFLLILLLLRPNEDELQRLLFMLRGPLCRLCSEGQLASSHAAYSEDRSECRRRRLLRTTAGLLLPSFLPSFLPFPSSLSKEVQFFLAAKPAAHHHHRGCQSDNFFLFKCICTRHSQKVVDLEIIIHCLLLIMLALRISRYNCPVAGAITNLSLRPTLAVGI
jgi:hypothetical protein